MGLSTALSAAVSGLTAAQTRATTVANNIANANTDGYVRRTTNLDERIVGGRGVGVDVSSISRQTADFLTGERMRFGADNAFSSEQATSASKIADLLGDPGAQDGLFGAYARFENSLRDAAATPESSVLQREVVDNANDIVRQFQTLAEQSASLRTQADTDIGRAVTEVNDALQRLEELNSIGGDSLTPDVLDERQRLVDRINDIIPVRAQNVGDSLNLSTEGGVNLLAQEAQFIEFSPAVLVTRGQSLGNGLSGLTVGTTNITPGGGNSQAVQGGRIAALFETRDERLPAFDDSIDALAADLVTRFADDAVDPTKTAGEVGLFTAGAPTLPLPPPGETEPDYTGFASLISVNAAIDPDQGGDVYRLRDGIGAITPGAAGNGDQLNRLIDAFTGLQPTPGAFGGAGQQTATGLAASLSSELNYDVQRSQDRALYAGTRLDAASNAEIQQLGVDTDAELQELIQIEQAYAANARVIQTISQLVDQLIQIT